MPKMNPISAEIIAALPYRDDFIFVDNISFVDEKRIVGNYTFATDFLYREAHFIHQPVLPGVFLLEMMGQIGPICHLIYLNQLYVSQKQFYPVVTYIEVSFNSELVYEIPIQVEAKKIYLRNNIIKSVVVASQSSNKCAIELTALVKVLYD
jgi:3-hydroxyacyl-[acyl-carrier-protein] dehydratase